MKLYQLRYLQAIVAANRQYAIDEAAENEEERDEKRDQDHDEEGST